MPEKPTGEPAAPERRIRRPSPLGLMGPPESEAPRANPLPSLRAVGIMVAFMVGVILVWFLIARGCA